tara:strand:- start:90 stop:515 length:426 start_codon:yes stop_codon:yes gene_type:complete
MSVGGMMGIGSGAVAAISTSPTGAVDRSIVTGVYDSISNNTANVSSPSNNINSNSSSSGNNNISNNTSSSCNNNNGNNSSNSSSVNKHLSPRERGEKGGDGENNGAGMFYPATKFNFEGKKEDNSPFIHLILRLYTGKHIF